MQPNTGYSGINSNTFFRAYNQDTRVFNKGLLTDMRDPDHIYIHVPWFEFRYGRNVVINHHLCGKTAKRRAEQHGGYPIVFSVNLDSFAEQDIRIFKEIKHGRLRTNSVVLDSRVVRVEDIYLVKLYIQDLCIVLEKLSEDEISKIL